MSMPAPAAPAEPSTMPTMAVIFGITLIATGVFAYQTPMLFGTGKFMMNDGHFVVDAQNQAIREAPTPHAMTSLAPAVIGAVLLAAGLVSIVAPGAQKHAMHAAALAALLGTIGGLIPVKMRENDTAEAAVMVGWIMTLTSLLFMALCINSFIKARKAREAGIVA
ncbi:MAG: hypothetical protein C0467_20545 [Planctomycetaceae bacterium]|nr:hypothetical protein [Planctomycetaceae bacterium]